jgi:hypothetical protein
LNFGTPLAGNPNLIPKKMAAEKEENQRADGKTFPTTCTQDSVKHDPKLYDEVINLSFFGLVLALKPICHSVHLVAFTVLIFQPMYS